MNEASRLVLLNTSILTAYGNFIYAPISLEDVKLNVKSAQEARVEILSAIGHDSTAQILSGLLDIPVKVNRIEYKQLPTDRCIVFKLNGRPEEGKILTKEEIEQIGYSFGLLVVDNEKDFN